MKDDNDTWMDIAKDGEGEAASLYVSPGYLDNRPTIDIGMVRGERVIPHCFLSIAEAELLIAGIQKAIEAEKLRFARHYKACGITQDLKRLRAVPFNGETGRIQMVDLDEVWQDVCDRRRREHEPPPCGEPCAWFERLRINLLTRWVGSSEICEEAARLTGAAFGRPGTRAALPVPPDLSDDIFCAEALLAQWVGLAPVTKMPEEKRKATPCE